MKENPEDKLEADSPGIELPDSHTTFPLLDAELAVTADSVENSYQLEPLQIIGAESNEFPQAPPIVYAATRAANLRKPIVEPPPVATELEGIAANGGAVGALVLGIWSILGSLLTYWSLINGIMGLVLGVWGLTSKRPRTAWLGIFLCLIGTFMSMALVSEMIADFWRAAKDP